MPQNTDMDASQDIKLLHSAASAGSEQLHTLQVKEKPLTFKVARDPEAAKHSKNEVLTLEEMEVPGGSLSMNVYIDLPEANDKLDAGVAEYVGSFHSIDKRVTSPKFPISSNIQALGLQDAPEVTVSIVPKGEDKNAPVPFKGAQISAY